MKPVKLILLYVGITVMLNACGGSSSDGLASDILSKVNDELTLGTKTNHAPTVSGQAVTSVEINSQYRFQPTSNDADSDTLHFTITNKPTWSSFDHQTGELSGQATEAGVTRNVVITVSDGEFVSVFGPFDISVLNTAAIQSDSNPVASDVITQEPSVVNRPPVIQGTPSTKITVGRVYLFAPTASDPDADSLIYSVTNKPAWLSFDVNTGVLSGIATESYIGSFSSLQISVSDGKTQVSLPRFSIAVEQRVNLVPSIQGVPLANITTGEAYQFTPIASDPENDILRFSIENKPSWLSFNTQTGQLSGMPTGDSIGVFNNLKLAVSDGNSVVYLADFSITVTKGANNAPVISGVPATTAKEGQLFTFTPVAMDVDGDLLTYSVVNMPSWLSFDSATGRLMGTPTSNDVTTFQGIVVKVTDGVTTVALPTFNLAVASTSATLSWTAPTTRTDGSPLPLSEIAGYKVYYGTNPQNLTLALTISNSSTTEKVFTGLSTATHYYAVTTYNQYGAESDFSEVVSKTIN